MSEDEYFIIEEHIPLDGANKSFNYGTDEPYDIQNDDHISEWALAWAMSHYKVGQSIPIKEFQEMCHRGKVQQLIDQQCELGLIEAVWNPKTCDVGYKITQKGIEAVETIKKRQ